MNPQEKKTLGAGLLLLAAFVLWTLLIQCVDVRPLGQNGTDIGFAALNTWFHRLCGVHMTIYTVTDWLGLVPIAGVLFLAMVREPYATAMAFLLLLIKGALLLKMAGLDGRKNA